MAKQPESIVYLVEDDVSFRRSTERLIESAGFKVEPFSSGNDFLRRKRSDAPSCLVLDVQLPGESGLDLQRELTKRGSSIPIIFITGHGDIPMSVRAIKAGAVEFLTKPFHDRDLLEAIKEAIALTRRAQESNDVRGKAGERIAAKGAAKEEAFCALHLATDVDSLWEAVQRVVIVSISCSNIGLTLQHNPIFPRISHWMKPIPDGPFDPKPLEVFLQTHPRSKLVRTSDIFATQRAMRQSAFYRHYLKPQNSAFAVGLFFWRSEKLDCVIVIMRTKEQGDFLGPELEVLRRLHGQFEIALNRLETVEREHSKVLAFEEFLRGLPLPTILLRWSRKLIYQNKAAREFCLLWREGPDSARLMKAPVRIPVEILDGCRRLKQAWEKALGAKALSPTTETLYHPKWPHLRVIISVKHLNAAGMARPHFLVQCEDMRRSADTSPESIASRLPHLARLTVREQEVTRLACDGRSNQEIADEAGLSLQMVKKHLHAIYRKLKVTSRGRLIALMR